MSKKFQTFLFSLALIGAVVFPCMANSIVDGESVTWTVIREYNKDSGGWDLKLLRNSAILQSTWITHDENADEDPFVIINPVTRNLEVFWSRQVNGEFRIYRAVSNGYSFSEPIPVTNGGEGFWDLQPFVQYGNDGTSHLVFLRQRFDGMSFAAYTRHTGLLWAPVDRISLILDDVIGTVTLHIDEEDPEWLEASYQYLSPYSGVMVNTRCVCKGGDTSPWSSCPDDGGEDDGGMSQ